MMNFLAHATVIGALAAVAYGLGGAIGLGLVTAAAVIYAFTRPTDTPPDQ